MGEFYGINPFQLTEEQLVGLWANMPRLEARRRRERLEASGATPTVDAVYELTLAETGSEERAQRAATAHAAALLRAGLTPE